MKENVTNIKRLSDRITGKKLLLGKQMLNIQNAYASQLGLEKHVKKDFWKNMDATIQRISIGEKNITVEDLKGHTSRTTITINNYTSVWC